MKGLIIKDLLLMKENWKQLLLFGLIFIVIGLEGNQILTFVPVFLSLMVLLSTFSYDDYNKWNSYAVTLPNGRKNIVRAKYIASICLSAIAILFTYFWHDESSSKFRRNCCYIIRMLERCCSSSSLYVSVNF